MPVDWRVSWARIEIKNIAGSCKQPTKGRLSKILNKTYYGTPHWARNFQIKLDGKFTCILVIIS